MKNNPYIKSFLERKGGRIVFSSFFTKLISFLISVFIIRIIPKEEYGFIVYAISIIAFIAPFKGFGIYQGFLRYGSISPSQQLKKYYFNRILFKGLLFSAVLILLLIALSPFVISNVQNSFLYLVVLSFQLITLLVIDTVATYARLIGLNKLYADINNYNTLLLFIISIPFAYLWGSWGYVLAMVLAPTIYSVFLLYKLKLFRYNKKLQSEYNTYTFLSYGFYMSLGGVLSQLLFAVDVILIGNIVKDAELIAQYKTSNIIPFSLLVLPVAIINTDYVQLAQKALTDKLEVWKYYINYLKIMSVFCMFILILFYFFSNDLLAIFGKEYQNDNNLMFVFAVGTIGALLFRNPLGNILSVIGWPKTNAFFSLIILIINVFAGIYFVNQFGIFGAAYTTSALMWLSGIFSFFALIYYIKK